jgi:hypothetical protein
VVVPTKIANAGPREIECEAMRMAVVKENTIPLYASKAADKARVYARFSDAELAAVRDFLQALEDAALDPADRARPTDRVGPADRPSRQARS